MSVNSYVAKCINYRRYARQELRKLNKQVKMYKDRADMYQKWAEQLLVTLNYTRMENERLWKMNQKREAYPGQTEVSQTIDRFVDELRNLKAMGQGD